MLLYVLCRVRYHYYHTTIITNTTILAITHHHCNSHCNRHITHSQPTTLGTNAVEMDKDTPEEEAHWIESSDHGIIAYTQRYKGTAFSPMDLHIFPFDKQVCECGLYVGVVGEAFSFFLFLLCHSLTDYSGMHLHAHSLTHFPPCSLALLLAHPLLLTCSLSLYH